MFVIQIIKHLLVVVFFVLFVSACQTTAEKEVKEPLAVNNVQQKQITSLTSGTWLLNAIKGVSTLKGMGGKRIYISFDLDKNKVQGFAGCNNFFAQFTATETEIIFGNLAMTRMHCQKMAGVESEFTKALGETVVYSIRDKKLFLQNEHGIAVVEFEQ